jgi:hypothetical protein
MYVCSYFCGSVMLCMQTPATGSLSVRSMYACMFAVISVVLLSSVCRQSLSRVCMHVCLQLFLWFRCPVYVDTCDGWTLCPRSPTKYL